MNFPKGSSPENSFYIEQATVTLPSKHMHYHDAIEIYYLINGERDYFIKDGFFKVKSGDVVLIPKNALHRTAGKGASRILIYVADSFLQHFFSDDIINIIANYTAPIVARPSTQEKETLLKAMNKMLSLSQGEEGDRNDAEIASELYGVLHYFARECSLGKQISHENSQISNIVAYINQNFRSISSIEDITNVFFLNKSYFCRVFSATLDIPFISYLNTLKIRYATTLLKDKKLTVQEVALQSGFHSASYFCKVFKKKTGISPKQFMENME